MTVLAAQAGKDIYCEKPLSLTVADGQAMIKAVRKHKRVLQMGSHWRSSSGCRRAAELVRNGRIGQVKRVVAVLPPNNAVDPGPGWKPMPVPEGFDYDFWLGPAPKATGKPAASYPRATQAEPLVPVPHVAAATPRNSRGADGPPPNGRSIHATFPTMRSPVYSPQVRFIHVCSNKV